MRINTRTAFLTLTFAAVSATPVGASHPCSSPLILDLEGDGIQTTGEELSVIFDINGDGELEEIGWTQANYEDAFLWIDLNGNHQVDDGSEFFGTSTLLPEGVFAANGFEALAVYDRRDHGGDGDGMITRRDWVWTELRLWIDRNHDAVSQRNEIHTLPGKKVGDISLDFTESPQLDGVLNLHAFQGTFVKQVTAFGRIFQRQQLVEDIFFVVVEHD